MDQRVTTNSAGRTLAWVLRGLGALPLLAYPLVLPASLMTLGTSDPNSPPAALVAVKQAFCWGSLAYPLVYVGGLALAERAAGRGGARGNVTWSALPLLYMLGLGVLFQAWGALDRAR
ncbi:hypothetical protein DAETH_33850 (plasmid) [Deinococcus aetherius]|uniref:Uncharacterized protein n=1 Tax=Deinococcus aetherius TaxID=200252 RepID=A0ABN6RM50_9DEIO|nr:hypothetical protein [Deinococcus aetherius]BDP43416.1 hypothetical protein DAETH_33850 [Deinococcus aetherius]